MTAGRLVTLSETECRELLGTSTVGLVAFVTDGHQELLPVNYVVADEAVFLQLSSGSVLGALAAGHPDVAFAVSYQSSVATHGWNVTVHGATSEVTDAAERRRILDSTHISPWAGDDRDVLVKLTPERIAGRRASRS